MGLLFRPVGYSGFPFDFARQFIKDGYRVCIETGTYKGNTALTMAEHFGRVYTIEASEGYYKEVLPKVSSKENLCAIFGDTREKLPEILKRESGQKIIFWLDAHQSEAESYHNVAPLMTELQAINESDIIDPIIFVDDARFMLGKVDNTRYADLPDFVNAIHAGKRYISCVSDAFIAVPEKYRKELDAYTMLIGDYDHEDLSVNAENSNYTVMSFIKQRTKMRIKRILPSPLLAYLRKLKGP